MYMNMVTSTPWIEDYMEGVASRISLRVTQHIILKYSMYHTECTHVFVQILVFQSLDSKTIQFCCVFGCM